MQPTSDLNVRETITLISPRKLRDSLPMSESANQTVVDGRESVRRILSGEDRRLMAIVGPCSTHDPQAAKEYAGRLRELARRVEDQICIVMRVYFEKPRTTVGWKGLINDPHLDDSFDMSEGLSLSRQLLLHLAEIGLPAATELLEPVTPQYIADLISLSAIGARTTESPTHRQMASGLSMPVGFKNGTDGSLQAALDAMIAARTPHSFLGIDANGQAAIITTKGNPQGFLILRGGRSGPNYARQFLDEALQQLTDRALIPRLVVDCSHANSDKDYTRQAGVWRSVLAERLSGCDSIVGLMLESNLLPGSQKLAGNARSLKYGISITDPCIGWEETEALILETHAQLAEKATVALTPGVNDGAA